jgi:hypothetical protein
LMLIHAPPDKADMELARAALRTMSTRFTSGFPTLTWVLESAGFSMPADARRAASEITGEFDQHNRARATLIEGDGFGASAVRSIVAGIDMVSRARQPGRVFSSAREAVGWCFQHLPRDVRNALAPEDIERALLATVNEARRGHPRG